MNLKCMFFITICMTFSIVIGNFLLEKAPNIIFFGIFEDDITSTYMNEYSLYITRNL